MTETQKIVHKEVCKGRSPQNLMTLIDNLCAFSELFKRQYDLINLTELSHAELASEVEKLLGKYHRKAKEIAERLSDKQEVIHKTQAEPDVILQRLHDISQAVAGMRGAMTSELDALDKDVARLCDEVTLYKFCPVSPAQMAVGGISVKVGVNTDSGPVIKNDLIGGVRSNMERILSSIASNSPFKFQRSGTIHVNDAPITGGQFTGSVDAKSLVGHSPFKFALDSFVAIANTAFDGRITARAEHLKGSNSYLVVYQPADGLLAESWINENELSALPFDPD